MIRPNATSPRVTSISRWYSSGATASRRRRPRRRGVAGAAPDAVSDANGHLLGEPAELVAAVLVVAELVERRACGGQQNGVTRGCVGRCLGDRRGQIARVGVGDAALVELSGD